MSPLRRLAKIPIEHPFAFGIVISTAKTSVSDLLVQKVVQKREEIDWKRNLAFASFGCFYLGGVQYALYVPLFGRLFPNAASFAAKSFKEKLKDRKGIFAVSAQVFLDQFVHHPLLYFPVFYATKEYVMSDKPTLSNALSHYRENMTEDLKALWKIWVPSTFINFAFMPMWGRIPWVAGTSFLWSMILSIMRGGAVGEGEELAGNSITGETLHLLEDSLHDLWASPVELDSTKAHICVSASGPDRIGWVSKIAGVVAAHGGNITHSKMVRLGNEFTVLMHVSIEPEQRRFIDAGLRNNKELRPLNPKISFLTRRQTGMFIEPTFALKIHCVGKDRPGILAKVAEQVAGLGMSVENLTTELRRGKCGRRDFVVNADVITCHVQEEEELKKVINDIQKLKAILNLDVLDVRVQRI